MSASMADHKLSLIMTLDVNNPYERGKKKAQLDIAERSGYGFRRGVKFDKSTFSVAASSFSAGLLFSTKYEKEL